MPHDRPPAGERPLALLEAALDAVRQAQESSDPLALSASTEPIAAAVRLLGELTQTLENKEISAGERAVLRRRLGDFKRLAAETAALQANAAAFAEGWLRTVADLSGTAAGAYKPDGEAEQTSLPSRVLVEG